MKSIRGYLLVSLIAALVAGSLLVAVFTYFSAAEEIDELYDKNMQEVAITLQSQMEHLNLHNYRVKNAFGPSLKKKIIEEEEFLIQVWSLDKQPIFASHRAISFPFQEEYGKRITTFEGKVWRTYGVKTDHFVIQVSQPQKARILFVRKMATHLLIPLLSLVPIVGLLIWLAVGRSLTPLNTISEAITKRSANSLEPISEEKTPLEIKPLVQELNELLMRLNISLKGQRRFTADAAHQLRTPLTALQLQLDNLKRAKNQKEQQNHIAKLQDGIERATQVVRQLLILARVEPNALEITPIPVDLAVTAREVMAQHIELATQKNIDFSSTRSEQAAMTGSAENLHILIENLVSNALHYTPEGGKVNVCTYTEGNDAVIEVQDNGIGIPQEERKRVFERFHRILGTNIEGTGLGLAIAKNIVEQHGGTIHVSDGIEGKGTSFIVRFPISQRESHA